MSEDQQQIVQTLLNFLIQVGIAAGVVLLGLAFARWVRRWARRAVASPRMADYLAPSMRELIVRAAFYLIVILSFALALIALGVPTTYVLGAIAIIVIVAGVALQQSLANLTATIIFFTYQPFRRDELIETMGQMGTVQEIQLFNTVLVTADGRLISLANSKVQEAGVINYTRMGAMRADAEITLAYTADLAKVRTLLLDLARKDPRVLAEPAPDVVVLELGESGIRIALRAFASVDTYWQLLFALRERATALLAAEGIDFARSQSAVTVIAEGATSRTTAAAVDA